MGTVVGVLVVGLIVASVGYFALRGDTEVVATPTPEATATLVLTATVAPSGTTAPAKPTATVAASPSPTPVPSPTLPAGRRSEAAPIQSVKVEAGKSKPLQYTVIIVASLPNGCAMKYTQDVKREKDVYTVTVLNSAPTGEVRCTSVTSTYEVRVVISDTLEAGKTYTVKVNDKSTTFKAQ